MSIVSAMTTAPLLGSGSAAAATLATMGAASIAGAQVDAQSAVRLAVATPQELTRLAANGDDRAQRILDQAETSRRLLCPVDLTV